MEQKQFNKTFVAETILRKKRIEEKQKEQKANQVLKQRQDKRKKKEGGLIKPDTFIKHYKIKRQSYAYLTRRKNNVERSQEDLPKDEKLLLVIRIRGLKNISQELTKYFKIFHLQSVNSAVFVKQTPKILKMLKTIEPYITYGYPSKKIISELIYKKGFGRLGTKREALNSNEKIEEYLGDKDIICLEDLVHEVFTLGKYFYDVQRFLWPFKLTACEDLKELKQKPYNLGGQWGNRETKINDLVLQMI